MVSLVFADIADYFIFFVANAVVCIFNDRQATCVVISCRLNNEFKIVRRLALSAELGPLYNRTDSIWSKGLSSEIYAAANDFIDPGLDASELGLYEISLSRRKFNTNIRIEFTKEKKIYSTRSCC